MIDWRKETQTMLKANDAVADLADDRIYLVTSKKDAGFPRIVIREATNEPSLYAEGEGWDAVVRLRVWMWAKTYEDWVALIAAVDAAMKGAKWARIEVAEDDYVPEANVFEKSLLYLRYKAVKPT